MGRGRQGTEEVTPRAMVLQAFVDVYPVPALSDLQKQSTQAQSERLAGAAACFMRELLKLGTVHI